MVVVGEDYEPFMQAEGRDRTLTKEADVSVIGQDGYTIWIAAMEDARERGEVEYRHGSHLNGYQPYYRPLPSNRLPVLTPQQQIDVYAREKVRLASACFCHGSLHGECA